MAVIKITEKNFEAEVLKSEVPVLVDFWAEWCGPCQMQGPVIDELSEEVSGVKFAKLNVDECMSLAQKYRVASIPTLLVFKDGKVAASSVGLQPKEGVRKLLGV
ncbi:MAG TPA: thioredoxin [Candidatus Merdisoma merdipullorum]|nr:thioredoxin [Candidatus Merdisoma merdipullorum]